MRAVSDPNLKFRRAMQFSLPVIRRWNSKRGNKPIGAMVVGENCNLAVTRVVGVVGRYCFVLIH